MKTTLLLGTLTLTLAAPAAAQQQPAGRAPAAAPQPPPTLAQEVEALRQQVKALEAQVQRAPVTPQDVQGVQADLENFKYQVQRDRETKTALSSRNLTIGGLVQTRAAWFSSDISTPLDPKEAATSVNNPLILEDRKTTFDIPNAIVTFNGLLYRDYESARNLGFSVGFAASPGSSNAGLGNANYNSFLTLLDANVTYQALPTIENDGNRLSFTLGQQLVPFGTEASAPEDLKPTIVNAQFVPNGGFNVRQIGLIARGELFSQYDFGYNYRQAALAFALGIVNGTGPNRDDENAFKDVVARVAFTVPAEYNSWLRELRVGASAYIGRPLLSGASESGGSVVAQGNGVRNRYGVDVYYNHFPWGVTYEYLRAQDDVWSATTFEKVRFDRSGHTATVFYSFGQQFLRSIKTQAKYDDWWPKTYQPFIRFDRWTPDQDQPRATNDIATLGFNVFFAETTKAQLEWHHRVQHVVDADSVSSDEVLAQLQFGF
ncbi:MAG: hypothetical protein QM767_09470 [Anaeromyxobacter sp.]